MEKEKFTDFPVLNSKYNIIISGRWSHYLAVPLERNGVMVGAHIICSVSKEYADKVSARYLKEYEDSKK